jgi:hypothetical protein
VILAASSGRMMKSPVLIFFPSACKPSDGLSQKKETHKWQQLAWKNSCGPLPRTGQFPSPVASGTRWSYVWFLASRWGFYHQPSDGCKKKKKLFFGREFRRGIRPQKLSRRRVTPGHLLKHGAGKVAVVFFVRDPLDLCGQRIGERNSFADAVSCAVTRLALVLFHTGNRHTLSDGTQ